MQQDSFFTKHAKTISSIAIAGIIFCIILIIFVLIQNHFNKKTYLSVQFAPGHAKLEIYGLNQTIKTGSYEMPAGTYTGALRADGFTSAEITFEVKPHQTNTLVSYLVHSAEGLPYFEKNAADISTLHQVKAKTTAQDNPELFSFLETYDRKASIFDLLPLTISWLKYPNDTPMYNLTISNGVNHPNCTSTLCLSTSGPKENLAELAKALAERGYDINDYEVFYEYSAI